MYARSALVLLSGLHSNTDFGQMVM
jgi:hypothetical protein